ncbi:MAG: FAD-dependent oxidoreductase [Pseudomonadota bacterium]
MAAPAPLFATRITAPTAVSITRWRGDPFARGSYSYLAKGAQSAQRADLARAIGPLFFAGEATSSDHPATVHGALLSGLRAARELRASGYARVAVIGAGIAGLAAAADLTRAGRAITVIEARPRIGGRIDTTMLGGAAIDRGASWIHGTAGNPLTALARRQGAELRVTDWDAYPYFDRNGAPYAARRLPRAARQVEISHSFGADPGNLSRRAYTEGAAFAGDDATFTAGYASLLPAFAGDYDIRTNRPVRRIDWSPTGGVTLTLKGGTAAFDAALITVPLGVLKSSDISFAPALSKDKETAIADLGMGHLSKVFLRFETPFWDPSLHGFGYLGDDPTRFLSWINIAQTNDAPILMAFHGGRAADALERHSDADITAAAMDVLRSIWA